GVRTRRVDHLVLQRLDLLTEELQHLEIMIHHRIQQGISQVVGTHEANAPPCPYPLPHPLEDVTRPLLEGQYEVRSEYQTHLLRMNLLTPLIELQHAQH